MNEKEKYMLLCSYNYKIHTQLSITINHAFVDNRTISLFFLFFFFFASVVPDGYTYVCSLSHSLSLEKKKARIVASTNLIPDCLALKVSKDENRPLSHTLFSTRTNKACIGHSISNRQTSCVCVCYRTVFAHEYVETPFVSRLLFRTVQSWYLVYSTRSAKAAALINAVASFLLCSSLLPPPHLHDEEEKKKKRRGKRRRASIAVNLMPDVLHAWRKNFSQASELY